MITRFLSRNGDFFKFSAVGLVALITYLFLYKYFLTINISGPASNSLGYILSILIGYFLNSKFTFKSKIGFTFFFKYLIVNFFSLLLNSSVYLIAIHLFNKSIYGHWLAIFLAIFCSTISNFIGLKKYAYS